MSLRSIRSRLLLLVVATVAPFLALVSVGLWKQWSRDHSAAVERSLLDARQLAAQIDDQLGNLEFLLAGLSRAVSADATYTAANNALLRDAHAELPGFVNGLLLSAPDGTNIGSSSSDPRFNVSPRAFFREAL